MEKIIHVLFNEEGAKNLQAAFKIDPTLKDEIIVMEDDWSVGPLAEKILEEKTITREEWLQLHFYYASNEEISFTAKDEEKINNILQQLQEDENLHVWIWAAQNARDACGYYWLLHHLQLYKGRLEIIYLNNLPFLNEKAQLFFPVSLSEIPPKEFPKAKRLAREITPSEIEVDTGEWQRLQSEFSILRLLEGAKKIISLEEDYYDKDLLNQCNNEWQKAGKILHQCINKSKQPLSETYLLWRMKELIAQEKLEYQGELKTKKDFEVKVKSDGARHSELVSGS